MFRKPYHLCPPKKPEMCGPGSNPNKKLWLNQNFVAGLVSFMFVLLGCVALTTDYFSSEKGCLLFCSKQYGVASTESLSWIFSIWNGRIGPKAYPF